MKINTLFFHLLFFVIFAYLARTQTCITLKDDVCTLCSNNAVLYEANCILKISECTSSNLDCFTLPADSAAGIPTKFVVISKLEQLLKDVFYSVSKDTINKKLTGYEKLIPLKAFVNIESSTNYYYRLVFQVVIGTFK